VEDLTDLPTRRLSLKGRDFDGNSVVLSVSVAKKLYRCPGCHSEIDVGREHILVRVVEPGGDSYHQHWHRNCSTTLMREMNGLHSRPAADVALPRPPRTRRKGKK